MIFYPSNSKIYIQWLLNLFIPSSKILVSQRKDFHFSKSHFFFFKADNGDDVVSLETFAKFLEWFGPFDKDIIKRISSIIQKE